MSGATLLWATAGRPAAPLSGSALLDSIAPSRLDRSGGTPGVESSQLGREYATAFVLGRPLRRSNGTGYEGLTRLPASATLATGLTFGLTLVDDPANPSGSGTVQLSVRVKRIVSGTDDLSWTGAAPEQTWTQAMPAVAGTVVLSECSIATADLPDSTAAGDLILVRVRRVIDSSDTHQGNVLLCGLTIHDT